MPTRKCAKGAGGISSPPLPLQQDNAAPAPDGLIDLLLAELQGLLHRLPGRGRIMAAQRPEQLHVQLQRRLGHAPDGVKKVREKTVYRPERLEHEAAYGVPRNADDRVMKIEVAFAERGDVPGV